MLREASIIGKSVSMRLALALVVVPTLAVAAPRVRLASDSACPDAPLVTARLATMGVTVVDELDAPVASLKDGGARYSIELGGQARVIDDPERRCAERADAAAVSIALVMLPAATPPKPTPPPRPVVVARVVKTHVDVELDGHIAGSGSSGPGFGGDVRLAITRGHFGGTFGVGGSSPVLLRVESASMSIARMPFDLSFRAGARWGRWELVGEIGFLAGLDVVKGAEIAYGSTRFGVDLGLRASVAGRVWVARRVGLVAGLGLEVVPDPQDVAVSGIGTAGRLPFYWFGGRIGVIFRAR